MTRWRQKIPINDLITEDDSAEAIIKAADGIVARLKHTSAPTGKLIKAKELAATDPDSALDVFNSGLARVYDWADDNGVWLHA